MHVSDLVLRPAPDPRPATVSASPARRPALDGVRAVAVAVVVVYHFGDGATSWLPGGFLGVDVFFVLSGYLITGLLVHEVRSTGRVDLAGFWVRRLRRLLPASSLLLVGVAGWTWWAARPETWPARRGDLQWTLGYLANWRFLLRGEDYFAAYSGASPLRHMWSLAVEEQFYVLWPLLVALGAVLLTGRGRCARLVRARTSVRAAVLVAVALTAVASAVWMGVAHATLGANRAYFGTDTRAFELLVGAAGAVWASPRPGRPRHPWPGTAAVAWTAVCGVLVAFVAMGDSTAPYYRGGAALVCLAVVAVLREVEGSPDGRLARWLSWRPAVALGRVSYGVYLWHWPITLWVPLPEDGDLAACAVAQVQRTALVLVLSLASYWLVERPVLRGRLPWVRFSRPRAVAGAVAAVACCLVVSLACTQLPGDLAAQMQVSADTECPGSTKTVFVACTRGTGTADPDLMVLGDSTARALGPGLDLATAAQGRRWVQAAWQRCVPTALLVVPNNLGAPDAVTSACTRSVGGVLTEALARWRPGTVVITEYYSHHQALLVDGRMVAAGTAEHDQVEYDAYTALVRQIRATGAQVVFLELPPPGESLGASVAAGRPAGDFPEAVGGEYVDGFNTVLRRVARENAGVVSVQVDDLFCPGGECTALSDGTIVRGDGVHVSYRYSQLIGPEILSRVDTARAVAEAESATSTS